MDPSSNNKDESYLSESEPDLENPTKPLFAANAPLESFGFRGTFLNLKDLVVHRGPPLPPNPYGISTCTPEEWYDESTIKDALKVLSRVPNTIRAQVTELAIPDIFTTSERDNFLYMHKLAYCVIGAFKNVQVVTLPVPDDLTDDSENEDQYEYRLWDVHTLVIEAFTRGQYSEIRFVSSKPFSDAHLSNDALRLYNVYAYIGHMVLGEETQTTLREKESQLAKLTQNADHHYTEPYDDTKPYEQSGTPSTLQDALIYDAWISAGYSIEFTQLHDWETGGAIALRRTPFTMRTFAVQCEWAVSWWFHRCAVCIASGSWGSAIMHHTMSCPRAGKSLRTFGLGRQIFKSNIKAKSGCRKCAYPFHPSARKRPDKRSQGSASSGPCPYGEIIYDVVVGMCQGDCHYRAFVQVEMEAETKPKDLDVALWLASPRTGKEEHGSRFVWIFLLWTRVARELLWKREMAEDNM